MNPGPRPDFPGREDLVAEAMRWAVRHDRGLAADEEFAFQEWLRQGPAQAAAFERAVQTVGRIARVAAQARGVPAPAGRSRRAYPAAVLAAAACLLLGLASWMAIPKRTSDPGHASWAATATSNPIVSPLPDGSLARLNVGAVLQAEFTAANRYVRLQQGEAFFSVQKDPARPFTVEVGDVEIRAVGTAFSVTLDRDEVDVIVTEGTVAIAGVKQASAAGVAEAAPLVHAGQRVRVGRQPRPGASPAVSTVSRAEIAAELRWNRPLIQFTGATLREVVARYAEIGGRRIEIADAALGELRLGGQFPGDDLDQFIHILTQLYDIRAEPGEDDTLVLHRRD